MVRKLMGKRVDVKSSCRILGISRSGFYAWLRRPESDRAKQTDALVERMKAIHNESDGTYGAPRLARALQAEGTPCGRHRVARLMRRAGLFGCARRKFRVCTTDSNHPHPIARRVFQVETPETLPKRPNQVWAGDITYVPTEEGWLYLAVQLDVFTRKIVGYALTDHLRADAVLQALRTGVQGQGLKPDSGLVSHSDRGCQYASQSYRQALVGLGITPSMSRKGNCYDNAYAESFFHTLKVELIHRRHFKTRAEAETAIFEYIEVWYNRRRLHSSLGYRSPNDYEAAALAA
jgi:transposase InsO family protein